ncbi:Zn-ribbon domain-containing OB-fold protein [Nocardia sp. alder85J]|uniref:Zn-ribbon domain-containing OB-fold protein n=1 Tax=Nocardia sp. alder85J TaxID=2862949 RepID=UPI001CD76F4E|nr:zinc ribbon domain-containing protein [Nocardia sp. alder85J]MCX4092972.1 zinc ribbon domain-containing protein [Nocardia sp. alder85J]
MRPLPEVAPVNEWFWRAGADGKLRIRGCTECGTLVHPPTPIRPRCRSLAHAPVAVSGRATVAGYTINARPADPAPGARGGMRTVLRRCSSRRPG